MPQANSHNITPEHRQAIEDEIERLIAYLDEADGDIDIEGDYLGNTQSGWRYVTSDFEPEDGRYV